MKQERVDLSAIEKKIRERPAGTSPPRNDELIAELMATVLKLPDDALDRGDLKILNRAVKELRYAFKVFAPFRSVRKVSLFGSGRIPESDPHYAPAAEFSRRLAQEGFMVITGAGAGVMQAGHEGAGREKSFGVNIRLPFEQRANRFIRDDAKLINFHFFFTRKLIFVKESDAVAFFPGGFGTHDEAMEILTLMQTGKTQLVPMVLLDVPRTGYWEDWRAFVSRRMLEPGYISEQDLSLFRIFDDPEAAVAEIRQYYSNFHSYRFVRNELIVRLARRPGAALLEALNSEFRDILTDGEIRESGPLPEESDDSDTFSFYRLRIPFNRRDFGRLRELIDAVNRLG